MKFINFIAWLNKMLADRIQTFIEEGRKMLGASNFEDFDRWKRSVQFFIEQSGTESMIKEITKEVNRTALWVSYPSQPKEELDEMFRIHKVEVIEKIISILEAIKSIGYEPQNTKKQGKNKRSFSQTVKNHVWSKQEGKCLKCKNQLVPASTQYDHVKAFEDGGLSVLDNCQALCSNCHSEKTHEDRLRKQMN